MANNAVEKLMMTIISGVIVTVVGGMILDRLKRQGELNGAVPPVTAAKSISNAVENFAGKPDPVSAIPNMVSTAKPSENVSDVSAVDSSVCHQRVVEVQDQSWPEMQRFLNPDNKDCLSLREGQKLSITINTCDSRVAIPGSVDVYGDYIKAFIGMSDQLDKDGFRGIIVERNSDGSVDKRTMSINGIYLNVTMLGNEGHFCGIDASGFSPAKP